MSQDLEREDRRLMIDKKIIGLSAVAVAFVIGVNVFALNAGKDQSRASNGVANEEPAVKTGSVTDEGIGSFDINGTVSQTKNSQTTDSQVDGSFTVNGLDVTFSENTSVEVSEDTPVSSEVIDDEPFNPGIELSDEEREEMNDMFTSQTPSDAVGEHDEGNISKEEMKENRYTILKTAKTMSDKYKDIYKSELIALAMIRSGYGNDVPAFKYNNYFHITAKDNDPNAVAVQYRSYEGEERIETLRKFNSTDECFEYMTQKLLKAGLCRPLSYNTLLKKLYDMGYLKTKLDLQNFHQQVLQFDTTDEFPDMLDTDRDKLISEIMGEEDTVQKTSSEGSTQD